MVAEQSKDEMLYNEVQNRNIEAVRALHHSGAGSEWTDKEGRTPLILACTRGDSFEMILELLNIGANLNVSRPGSQCGTPLHHAAKGSHENIVALLLHRGANPLVLNDDRETPLQMARAMDHVTVVRLIEEWISLFCENILLYSPRCFLRRLFQCIPNRRWAVVLPSASNDPSRPPTFELVIYPNPKVSQPRRIILLSEIEIKEPKFSLGDPTLVLVDKSTGKEYEFLSETEGDKKQIQRLYEACKGIHQRNISATAFEHLAEDVQLAIAMDASLQLEVNLPDAEDHSAQPGSSNIAEGQTTNSVSGPSLPENAYTARSPMSAPAKEYTAGSDGPIIYPSIDLSPIEVNLPDGEDHSAQPSTNSNKLGGNTFGSCLICLNAPAVAACIPCGHIVGCMECLNGVKEKKWGCPFCRASIEQVVKMYAPALDK